MVGVYRSQEREWYASSTFKLSCGPGSPPFSASRSVPLTIMYTEPFEMLSVDIMDPTGMLKVDEEHRH